MTDHKSPPIQPEKSRVILAWEAERALCEPVERRHAWVVFMAVVLAIAGMASAITLAAPVIVPAVKSAKAWLKAILG